MEIDANKPISEQSPITEGSISPSDEAQAFMEMSNRVKSLEAENKSLQKAKRDYYDAILNGQTLSEASGPKKRSVDEIRKDLMTNIDKGCTNLKYAELSLELDDAVIEETGESCFLPKGHDQHGNPIRPTMDEYATAQRFHEVLQDCVETADGDPEVFNVEFARMLSDNPKRKANAKK